MGKKSFQPIIMLAAIFMLFSGALNLSASETKTSEIKAQKYTFQPERIEVKQGDQVILEVTALDTKHGVGIKEYDIEKVLLKNKTITIEFIAEKKGEFTIKCTEFCGWGHFGMQGVLVVN